MQTPNDASAGIPYGRQWIDRDDVEAVVEVLRSDWLTTGPAVERFESAVADFCGAPYAVAVSSGTAALHAAMFAINLRPGDEVIVTPMTFAATANCVLYQGGTPVFADVDPLTLLVDPECVRRKITPRTKAVIAVDYAGQPCDYDALAAICREHGLVLVSDACHSLGASYRSRPVGTLADLTVLSFHPVKHITTGEGGMALTRNSEYASRLRLFRNHGIATDHRERALRGSWVYDMAELGYNYRITDFQCALGMSQLRKLPAWLSRRREIASRYDTAFRDCPAVRPLEVQPDVTHAYHLYPVRLEGVDRGSVFTALRSRKIYANVHYIPVHLHSYYQKTLGLRPGLCPAAEAAYEQLLSLPMFPKMSDGDVETVISAVLEAVS